MQTSLKYSELSEKHKVAGAKYASMRRRLDVFILTYRNESNGDREKALKEFEEIAPSLERAQKENLKKTRNMKLKKKGTDVIVIISIM